jgi:glycosyltransferase involved in cell wall biosynthesis
MKTCVFIPAWNVRGDIVNTLERIPAAFGCGCAEVFVLDNASSDGTPDAVLQRLRRGFPFPVRVYRNRRNLGYGGSQKVAYAHAIRQGYDVVAMLHGDGQYPPGQLPALVAALADGWAGMAYGCRRLEQDGRDETPLLRRLGIRGLSLLQSAAAGLALTEWFSGFRAFRCAALREVPFQACDSDYYFDVQIILLLRLAGHAVAEIPVAKQYAGNRSPLNIWQFGRKALARLPHYPLARCGLVPGRLYRPEHWAGLRQTPVPAPIPVEDFWRAAPRRHETVSRPTGLRFAPARSRRET